MIDWHDCNRACVAGVHKKGNLFCQEEKKMLLITLCIQHSISVKTNTGLPSILAPYRQRYSFNTCNNLVFVKFILSIRNIKSFVSMDKVLGFFFL